MKEIINREEAYKKIIRRKMSSLNNEEKIKYCLAWVGINESDEGYHDVFDNINHLDLNFNCTFDEGKIEILSDFFISAVQYNLYGMKNQYLEKLLDNEYKIEGSPEKLHKCVCCHYYSIVELSVKGVCPICGWDNHKEMDEIIKDKYIKNITSESKDSYLKES